MAGISAILEKHGMACAQAPMGISLRATPSDNEGKIFLDVSWNGKLIKSYEWLNRSPQDLADLTGLISRNIRSGMYTSGMPVPLRDLDWHACTSL